MGRGHWVRMAINLCHSWRQDEDSERFHFIYIFCLVFTTQYIRCVCRFRILHLSYFIPPIKICNSQRKIYENLISGGYLANGNVRPSLLAPPPPPLIRSRISWRVRPSSCSFASSMIVWMRPGRMSGFSCSKRSGTRSEMIWLARSPRSPPPRRPSKFTWK